MDERVYALRCGIASAATRRASAMEPCFPVIATLVTRGEEGFSVIYERDRTRLIVLSGLLTALSIVFSRLFGVQILVGGIGALRLGFGPLPVIIASFLGGPWVGAAVGAAADLIGYVINPFGAAFVPHIAVVSTLTGVFPALILRTLRLRTDAQPGFISYLIAIAISQVALHIGAMSFIMYSVFGVPVRASLIVRAIAQAIQIPVYSVLTHLILNGAYASLVLSKRQRA